VIRYHLRAATEDDRAFLYDLMVATMKEYVAQTWGWDEEFQRRRFLASNPATRSQIIVVAGQEVGAVSIVEREAELFLASLLILPAHQRQGLGTAILQDLFRRAATLGVPVGLQVLKVNPARRLYERLGFTLVGETPTHWLMRRDSES
jgi:GNAT superfamily N-acetyltransferase